jgi:hypothetical protein
MKRKSFETFKATKFLYWLHCLHDCVVDGNKTKIKVYIYELTVTYQDQFFQVFLSFENIVQKYCGINHRRLKIEDRRKNRTTLA